MEDYGGTQLSDACPKSLFDFAQPAKAALLEWQALST
jgi:hypothetical protein